MKIKDLKYIFLFFALLIISCEKDRAEIEVTDFTKKQTIRLEPYSLMPYSMINIHVTGYVNDTIKIIQEPPFYDIKLVGELDTVRKIEYYGEGNKTFVFDPYRATNGKLNIKIKL